MKKIISMCLVLTTIVTTLMSVMVVDVNAVKLLGDNGEDINTRVWTVNMKSSGTGYTTRTAMSTGKWVVMPSAQAEGGQASYDLGTIERISKLGKTYWHLDFNNFTYVEGDAANKISGNYLRFRTDSLNVAAGSSTGITGANDTLQNLSVEDLNNAVGGTTVDGNITRGGVVKYTMYAYTQDKNTEPFTIQIANPGSGLGSLSISAAKLYSENGIPHKLDVYIWSNSADNNIIGSKAAGPTTEALYYNVVVDGVATVANSFYAESNANMYNATGLVLQPYLNFQPSNKESYDFKGSDWYVSHDSNKNYSLLTRENLDENAFVNITLKDTYTTEVKDGANITIEPKENNITGIVESVDGELEAAVLAEEGGDRVVGIYESIYNNPASIFTGETTNVKLVDKTTGVEVAIDEIPANETMDNYYFMINGVYVKAQSLAETTILYTSEENGFLSPSNTNAALTTGVGIELKKEDTLVGKYTPASGKTNFLFNHSDIDVSADYGKYFVYELSMYMDNSNGGKLANVRLASNSNNAILSTAYYAPATADYNKWHKIQYVVYLNETAPEAEMWFDGKKIKEATPTAAFGDNPYLRFAVSGGSLPTIYLDDIKAYTTITKPDFSTQPLSNTSNYTINSEDNTIIPYSDTIANIKTNLLNNGCNVAKVYRMVENQLTEVVDGDIVKGDVIAIARDLTNGICFDYYSVEDISYIKESNGVYTTKISGVLVVAEYKSNGELIKLTTGATTVTPIIDKEAVKIKAFVFDSLGSTIPQCRHLVVDLKSE